MVQSMSSTMVSLLQSSWANASERKAAAQPGVTVITPMLLCPSL